MGKINVTIPAKSPAQPCHSLTTPKAIGRTAGAFFLIFDCEIVEPSLTNPKSITYRRPPHSITQTVNL
jgi:hypothetical protein